MVEVENSKTILDEKMMAGIQRIRALVLVGASKQTESVSRPTKNSGGSDNKDD